MANQTQPSAGRRPPGVILLQIDGLSRFQFERALHSGRMPFLRKQIETLQRYGLKSFYPGQPSCTPAVQAELHFGTPAATPAFSFFDRETENDVRMYDAEWATRIAQESETEGERLLEGGSSYANIYIGGAKKAKYCGELNTVSHWLTEISPLLWLRRAFRHPRSAFKITLLIFVEIFLAIRDAVLGILRRGDILSELTFVPARVGVAIALREAIRREAIKDIKEGLPIVHANFFGYDEAAHRRGPHARFALWTLRGIDRTLKSIANAASKSQARDYVVIFFSDHGQEPVIPYRELTGRTLEATLGDYFKPFGIELQGSHALAAFMERSRKLVAGFSSDTTRANDPAARWLRVHAMGPVAHAYVKDGLDDAQKAEAARVLCLEREVPVIIYMTRGGEIVCRVDSDTGGLETLARRLKERGHEFVHETIADLEAMVRTRYSGDLVLLGWRHDAKSITFAEERGAHAGPGAEECRGFVALPRAISWNREWMRPLELRRLVLESLGRQANRPASAVATTTDHADAIVPIEQATRAIGQPPHPIDNYPAVRIASYNVHGGVGSDRRRDTTRIAAVIEQANPSIVCFQEAFESENDAFSLKAMLRDLWHAEENYAFLPLHQIGRIRYGLAIASKIPFRLRKSEAFAIDHPRIARFEPRGAIWIEIEDDDQRPIHIVNTHLGLRSFERMEQTQTLLGPDWLGALGEDAAIVVCGDMNAGPSGNVYRAFARRLSDTQLCAYQGRAEPSFVSWAPVRRIDHIFASRNTFVAKAGVIKSRLARRTSDHLPVFAELSFPA